MIADDGVRQQCAHILELALFRHAAGERFTPTHEVIELVGRLSRPDDPAHRRVTLQINFRVFVIMIHLLPHRAACGSLHNGLLFTRPFARFGRKDAARHV
ncbi:MAG: hypothetical protein ACTHQM_24315, partial [Thermoanaerobaculia bacterium]